ncbi:MAG: hypothetical protein LUC97_07005 [Clostridiales bacterium]|nr:hypothetical protein [Clostridiales bacterium]
MTKYRMCLIVLLMLSLMTLGVLSGYFLFTPDPEKINVAEKPLAAETEPAASQAEKIDSNTKIIYEYVYLGGHKEQSETTAPRNWQGLTLTEFKGIFDTWQIKEFSGKRVVLSKNLKVYSPKHYVLGVYEGYVAVFRKNEFSEDKVKEITETPVSALPETEQKRLSAGIDFYGDEELARILQDYET